MNPSVIKLSVILQFTVIIAVLVSATWLAYVGSISGEVVATVFGGALGYAGGSKIERGRAGDNTSV